MVRILMCLFLVTPLLSVAQQSEATQSVSKTSLSEQLNALVTQEVVMEFHNKLWVHLRFADVPTAEQKQNLEAAGVTLHQYFPDLKWMASMPTSIDPEILISAGVSRLWVKPWNQRIDSRIPLGLVPAYAKTGASVNASIVIANDQISESMDASLEKIGITILDRFIPLGILEVTGTASALIAAAQLPFIVYVELPEPPAELEIEDEMTMTRAPYINGYYNLDGLTGEGVDIAVNEGGIVDTTDDPNFKNRLDRSLENGTVSGHKTGVSWRMASAGNITPIERGQAWGSTLHSGGINFTNAAQNNITIVNNSFGYGCISGTSTYNTGAATNDFLVRTYERFMITYSCGNIGGSTCAAYGAGAGWGSITGLVKSAKNIFAVGAMNTDEQLTGFSSRGPAKDGRILPDITATGPGGTSHASPNLAGVNALLTEAYRNENANQWPNTGLIKAIILNTADDLENPGPDFRTGFGRINGKRALEVIENSQFLSGSVSNNGAVTHSITVPAGVSQVKITLYWNDREATAGITGKTLVNDLDLRVQDPNSNWVQPWVLNTFPHEDSLTLPAVHGTDTLNNVEMVTINNPAAGTYTAEATGSLVPFGPQVYRIVYSFVYDSLTVIYPRGGEAIVPGENRRIRWDAYGDASAPGFDIEFSSDSGTNWQTVASGLSGETRSYNWNIPNTPNTVSGNCLVRVSKAGQSATSESRFTISSVPTNLNLIWRCADSAMFAWDTVANVMGYRVYQLGNKFMDTVAYTSDPFFVLHNLSGTETEWVSVQTVLADSGSGRRAIALDIAPGDFNCISQDLALIDILSPQAGYYPSCLSSDSLDLQVMLQNAGVSALTYLPLAFQLNGGTIMRDTLFSTLASALQSTLTVPSSITLASGTNELRVWTTLPNDGNATNDTLVITLEGYSGTSASLPYSENFDSFTTCSTAWGCASVTCTLSQGWTNLPNIVGGDSIDWRTHSGGTGSGGTGPSGDHTTGNGNYLYLEGSGNGGSGCQNKVAMAHSPCLDLSGTNNPILSYWYHALGGAIGSLHVDVLASGQWHLDVAPVVSGAQGNQWLQQSTSLAAFTGQEVIVRFRGTTGGGWASDLAMDDINLSTLPLADFETLYDGYCLGQNVQLQNLTTYGTSYSWSILQGSFNYASGNSSSANPTITPLDTGWFDVQLIANNTTGSDTLVFPNMFYVGGFDSPTLMSDGLNNTWCFGDTASFVASGAGDEYEFYRNGILEQSDTLNSWTATNLVDGDSIWVVNFINPTCVVSSNGIAATVKPDYNGTQLWTDDDDLTICEGDTVIIGAIPGLSQYDFYIDASLEQQGADSIFVTSLLMHYDQVYAEVVDDHGCTGTTAAMQWSVNPIPATPNILHIGNDSLKATIAGTSYIWWYNGQLLTDTTQTILASGSGMYHVQVVEFGCASLASEEFDHTMLGLNQASSSDLRIFPNPTRDVVHILSSGSGYDHVSLISASGQVVHSQSLKGNDHTMAVDQYSRGVYTLVFRGNAGSREFKLVLQ